MFLIRKTTLLPCEYSRNSEYFQKISVQFHDSVFAISNVLENYADITPPYWLSLIFMLQGFKLKCLKYLELKFCVFFQTS